MEKDVFMANLRSITERTLEFTQEHASDDLPQHCRYLIMPNSSYDGHPLKGDEVVFPEDELPEGEHLDPMNADEVVSFLWRHEKVPEWINVKVLYADADYTYMELRCCGRFSAGEHLYYQDWGAPPFVCQMSGPPLEWYMNESGEIGSSLDFPDLREAIKLKGRYTLPPFPDVPSSPAVINALNAQWAQSKKRPFRRWLMRMRKRFQGR